MRRARTKYMSSPISARLPKYEPRIVRFFRGSSGSDTSSAPPKRPTTTRTPLMARQRMPSLAVDAAPTQSITAQAPPLVRRLSLARGLRFQHRLKEIRLGAL